MHKIVSKFKTVEHEKYYVGAGELLKVTGVMRYFKSLAHHRADLFFSVIVFAQKAVLHTKAPSQTHTVSLIAIALNC